MRIPAIVTLSLAAVLAVVALTVADPARAFLGLFSETATLTPKDGTVSFALADVADGKVHFFAVAQNDKQIRFFAVKSPEGRVRTAFDACDVCYPEKKGYRQDGEFVVCTNCGRRFHMSMVGEARGGCNPSPLASAVAGDRLEIKLSDLAAGAAFF